MKNPLGNREHAKPFGAESDAPPSALGARLRGASDSAPKGCACSRLPNGFFMFLSFIRRRVPLCVPRRLRVVRTAYLPPSSLSDLAWNFSCAWRSDRSGFR